MCAEVSELAWAGHNAAVRKTKAARKWISLVSQPNEPVVEGLWLKQKKKSLAVSRRGLLLHASQRVRHRHTCNAAGIKTRDVQEKCTFVFPVSASYPQRMLSKNCLLPLVLSISPFRFGLRFFYIQATLGERPQADVADAYLWQAGLTHMLRAFHKHGLPNWQVTETAEEQQCTASQCEPLASPQRPTHSGLRREMQREERW